VAAAAFAVVGDFEDAIYCWRTQAREWLSPNEGVLLAAAAGALRGRLGLRLLRAINLVSGLTVIGFACWQLARLV